MRNCMVFIVFLILLCLSSSGKAEDLNKKVVGKWYNPYTYDSSGEMKGFWFKKNGKCKALGIKTLDLRTWEVKNGRLIIKGYSLTKDGKEWEDYETSERIEKVNSDSLYVIAAEKPFKMGFLYLTPKCLKKKVKPGSNHDVMIKEEE
ncbi:MAG: lipocalin family protein [Odoribacter splanchnicus]